MILPDAPWRRRPGLAELVAVLGADEGRVRYVGGAVRDTLLDLPVADLDLATSLAPEEAVRRIKSAGLKAVPTGIAHGTVTAVLPGGWPVEVTTLRRDIETDGRHARVAFTDDWRADAARRDFTINALSADPLDGIVHDYFGGLADLETACVRFIGPPAERIAEDHLRILRFFRFHARFGRGTPDAASLDACVSRAADLMALSRERIAQELLKLLAVEDPAATATLMVGRGVLRPVLPEISLETVARLRVLTAVEPDRDPLRRLAALLPRDPATVEEVAARLKLSNAQRKRLALAADPAPPGDPRRLAHAIGTEGARDRLLLAGDAAGAADIAGWTPPRLPLGGGDLIALGLTPGPAVAAALRRVERRWVAEGFPNAERVREIAAEEAAED